MKYWLHQFLSRFFLSGCSDYNPLKIRRACRSKAQARMAFKENNFPYAQGEIFINPISAFKFAKKNGFPLVVKPNVGGFSRGAYFPINTYMQLAKASLSVKKWWLVSIVEKYLLGKNYRIVMTKFGVMSILRRYPPFVIGDNVSDIDKLIDNENQVRKKMDLLPIIKPIPKNLAIKQYLKKQQMNLSSIPNVGQKVYLHHKISLKLGSSVEVIDKKILTKQNRQDLKKILNFFDANILGIDVICKQGIEIDFNAQVCIFLELNSRPFLAMHNKPRYGKSEDLSIFYHQLDKIQIFDHGEY